MTDGAERGWRNLARCANAEKPDTFFPAWGDRGAERAAKRMCNGTPAVVDGVVMGPSRTTPCPVREACLAAALEFEAGRNAHDRFGVWGGLTPTQRANLDPGRRASHRPAEPAVCPWPGTSRGLNRHAELGAEQCPPCRRLELAEAARRERDERVLGMRAAGASVGQIALAVGERRDTVRGILSRHEPLCDLEADSLEFVFLGQVAVGD